MKKLQTAFATITGVIVFFLIFLALRWGTKTTLAVLNVLIYRGEGHIPVVVISTVFLGCKILAMLGAMFIAYRLGGRRMIPVGATAAVVLLFVLPELARRFGQDWLHASDNYTRLVYAFEVLFFSSLIFIFSYLVVKGLQKRRKPPASQATEGDRHS